MIKAIIIDDEFHGRENLRILLEKFCPILTVVKAFEYPLEAYDYLKEKHIDLVFLDIGMPEIDGLEFIELFPVRNFQVIYITAFEDFGIQAIKFGVIDYIVKPVSVSELQSAVAKAVNLIEDKGNKNKQKVRIPTSKGTDIVDTNSIVYIESDTYLCSIYLTSSEKIVISKSLKHFEEILPTDIFFRIHRSVLINLNFVESYSTIDGGTVKLKGFKSKLPISRRSKVEFFQKMKTFTF